METPNAGRRARATIRRPQPVLAAGILALAALITSGCASPAAPAPSTDPAPPPETSTPTAEPDSRPGAQPASRYDLSCDELVPTQAVSDMFDVPLEPVDPLVTAASAGIAVPRMTSILSIGGLACEWSNGEPYNSQYGGNPAYAGVLVTVVPEQDTGWSSRAASAGLPADATSCGPDFCTIRRVGASGAWIEIFGSAGPGTILPAGATAFADAALAAVDAAGPPAPAPAIESSIPADCDALVPLATVESITGTAGLVAVTTGGGWSEWAEARAIAGDLGCRWMPTDVEEIVVAADWVRGGLWAFERIQDAGALVPAASEISVPGADRALLRCDAAYGTCGVDLLVGPDWIQVTAPEEAWAVDVAEEIAAGLAG